MYWELIWTKFLITISELSLNSSRVFCNITYHTFSAYMIIIQCIYRTELDSIIMKFSKRFLLFLVLAGLLSSTLAAKRCFYEQGLNKDASDEDIKKAFRQLAIRTKTRPRMPRKSSERLLKVNCNMFIPLCVQLTPSLTALAWHNEMVK